MTRPTDRPGFPTERPRLAGDRPHLAPDRPHPMAERPYPMAAEPARLFVIRAFARRPDDEHAEAPQPVLSVWGHSFADRAVVSWRPPHATGRQLLTFTTTQAARAAVDRAYPHLTTELTWYPEDAATDDVATGQTATGQTATGQTATGQPATVTVPGGGA